MENIESYNGYFDLYLSHQEDGLSYFYLDEKMKNLFERTFLPFILHYVPVKKKYKIKTFYVYDKNIVSTKNFKLGERTKCYLKFEANELFWHPTYYYLEIHITE